MVHETELKVASQEFFKAFSLNITPQDMVSYFSTTYPVIIQHAPASCPHASVSRLIGPNALRSYFDLLATYWIRSDVKIRISPQVVDKRTRSVLLGASVTWMWRKSGRKWTEDFTWMIEFDEGLKIISLITRTVSEARTCVMRATDTDRGISSHENIVSYEIRLLYYIYLIVLGVI